MIITCTSDLHGNLPEIPDCDLLLIAGDILPHFNHAPSVTADRDWGRQWLKSGFYDWLRTIPAKEIVGVAGNHDWAFVTRWSHETIPELPWHYLKDSSVEIQGLKIWGGPWTKTLCGWAFELGPNEMAQKWGLIPKDVDIIMVHGPVYGFGDKLVRPWPGEDPHAGCKNLYERIIRNEFPNLKAVVTGHIHEGYGKVEAHGIQWINPSHMNVEFEPVNPVITFEI